MVSVTDDLSDLFARGEVSLDLWLDNVGLSANGEEGRLLASTWQVVQSACGTACRPSGESYFEHALSVATILAGLKLDAHTIAAGMLHDLPELAGDHWLAIRTECDPDAVALVEGVERMDVVRELRGQVEASQDEGTRTEALRKMLLAMAEDIRVVFIKLAERLHDLRTLRNRPESVQYEIARETSDIYAPLANRLGIWQVKWEMEDLCFRYLEPVTYKRVAKLLREKRQDRERYIRQVIDDLDKALTTAGIEADVGGRPKHIFSIWKKMQRKGLDFHELFDIRAVRVLVHDVAACYATLGVVHSLWKHVPREFDDYIATPKENNYQSLHTAVIGPEGKTLEVQIRTHEMHEQAELGVAAHWRYKEGRPGGSDERFEQRIAWLRQLLEWGREENGAEDFIDRFKAEVFEDRVYVISPRGDVIDLPRGATPLDFAYHIHSDIGHRCRGGKINGRIVPLNYELRNGDQVEILTSKSGAPSRDWLNPARGYLRTSRARGRVRSWFKQLDFDKNVTAGRQELERELHRLGLQDVNLEKLAQKTRFPKVDDFLAAIGRGDVTAGQVAGLLGEHVLPKRTEPALVPRESSLEGGGGDDVSIYGVGNLLTRMAGCCKPAPGDAIIGFITRGQGVTIHRRDCPTIRELMEIESERLIEVSWRGRAEQKYPVDIQIDAYDRQGLLRDITAILTNEKINVLGVNTSTGRDDHRARMTLTVEIGDVTQMSRLMDRIAGLRNVVDVCRRRP
ncbi:GTP pyrophosphokinase [Natronocella acetinitrilica]|uniref:GTP pyrophosphokinase n=1 Tax=Natronocella acetinitrilica TaxID=414046 RepID=A0AAE3G2R0_9GAMM|nr:GTP diphosphokinase [Natronocella acetinitrilica]MCP1674716.1 GTP pyrophosphokinase [Natronocella acetinitrilica]